MDRAEFVTIVNTMGRAEMARRTLTSIIAETITNDARLIVHDCSLPEDAPGNRAMLESLRSEHPGARNKITLISSDTIPLAHARNMAMRLALDLHAPDYIAMVEDDHGFRPGLIAASVEAMREHYGKKAPNGLRFGMFTTCAAHAWDTTTHKIPCPGGSAHTCPTIDSPPPVIGGVNNCCRMAPTSHWLTVLGAYDTDEYPISTFQTSRMVYRNYHKGFTRMIVHGGDLMFDLPDPGRGTSAPAPLYDEEFTASDQRSRVRHIDDVA